MTETSTLNTASTLSTLYVAIDDTDDISKATSTGYIADLIAKAARALGGRLIHGVTRHQLLLDPSVPYTSHNSAMAFCLDIPAENIQQYRKQTIEIIQANRAESSDPGLCFAVLPADRKNGLYRRQRRDLIDFGNAAITVYCSQQKAYSLAAEIPWISLTAHGGDGQGVVGALAGIGLRLSGGNGRFRGSVNLTKLNELDITTTRKTSNRDKVQAVNQFATVQLVIEQLKEHLGGKVRIIDRSHQELLPETRICLSKNVKAILQDHAFTIIADIQDNIAYPLGKTDLDELFPKDAESLQTCQDFQADTDTEEQIGVFNQTCVNCLYRRWESDGFSCVVSSKERH